jgi:hypothetical protein
MYVNSYHDQFYNDPNFVNFSKNVNIPEETIDTETKSIEEVIDTIFSKIESLI